MLRSFLFVLAFVSLGSAQAPLATVANSSAFIPYRYASLLPVNYTTNVAGANNTGSFVDTVTGNATIDQTFAAARNAVFIAVDQSFYDIFGRNPVLELHAENETTPFYEGGAWDYDHNAVWFSSRTGEIGSYNLSSGVTTYYPTDYPTAYPLGATYAAGKLWWTGFGRPNYPSSVVTLDPVTRETEIVFNSYFGRRFNGLDDIAYVSPHNGASGPFLFVTETPYGASSGILRPAEAPSVWRYDLSTTDLLPVISTGDIAIPNGVRANKEGTLLYVTDTSGISLSDATGFGTNSTGSPAIFVYDLTTDGRPVNKRLFGLARSIYPDGLHVDDAGRVYTAEGEGIVIRNTAGRTIGLINARPTDQVPDTYIANFALAGNKLVILALNKLWTVQLAQTVVAATRS